LGRTMMSLATAIRNVNYHPLAHGK
jgi:hypothetical protein